MAPEYEDIVGCPATTMFPDEDTALGFRSLMEGVFVHRRPLVAVTPVRLGNKEMQVSLHCHAVRFGRRRLLLVILEEPSLATAQRVSGKQVQGEDRTVRVKPEAVEEPVELDVAGIERLERLVNECGSKSKVSDRTEEMKQADRYFPYAAASEAIVICDLRGRAMYTNDSFTRLFGRALPDLPATETPPKDVSYDDNVVSRLLSWMANPGSQEQSASNLRSGSEKYEPWDVRASRFTDHEGNTAGMMFLLRDDSESKRLADSIKRSEEAARALLAMSEDAMVLVDIEGFVLASNAEFAKRVHLPVERFVGRQLADFFPPHLMERRMEKAREAVASRKPVRFLDESNGRYLDNMVCPLFDANGRVESLAIVSRDITDDQVGLPEVEGVNERVELANRAKNEFLANVSHELRTPLNAIIGFSEILEDQLFGQLNEKQKAYVGHVLSSGRQLLQLIDNILDLANVETGQIELRIAGVDIRKVLESCMVLIREKAAKQGLEIHLALSEELADMRIEGDQAKLKQIVFNLLSNATKFTPSGGTITVSAARLGDEVVVEVTDTGIGLKPEDQDRVFHAFEQVDSSHTRRHDGTGLGLALTRKMVELHGGRIWVESLGEGLGSTFGFAIPVCSPLPNVARTS